MLIRYLLILSTVFSAQLSLADDPRGACYLEIYASTNKPLNEHTEPESKLCSVTTHRGCELWARRVAADYARRNIESHIRPRWVENRYCYTNKKIVD